MPLTHLARIVHPAPPGSRTLGGLRGAWHYWWQAHYLDAVVDAGLRSLRTGDPAGADRRAGAGRPAALDDPAAQPGALGQRLLRRHGLARPRLGPAADLHDEIGRTARRRRLRSAGRHLTDAAPRRRTRTTSAAASSGAATATSRTAPRPGPAALHLARLGETDEARRLVDWLYARLWSPESGLVLDGIRLRGGEEVLVPDVWSYNQGTVLGALVTLGDPAEPRPGGGARRRRRRAADRRGRRLAGAADARRRRRWPLHRHPRALPRARGGPGLGPRRRRARHRATGSSATRRTALWRGRGQPVRRGAAGPVGLPPRARRARAPGPPLELSPQLQAWTVLEAAATLP